MEEGAEALWVSWGRVMWIGLVALMRAGRLVVLRWVGLCGRRDSSPPWNWER